jgi:hypothetical protein
MLLEFVLEEGDKDKLKRKLKVQQGRQGDSGIIKVWKVPNCKTPE